jgi:hypothetical protein
MVGNERFYLATTLDLTEAQVKVNYFFFCFEENQIFFFFFLIKGLVSKSSY